MMYSIVTGCDGVECGLESTFCTNPFCDHPCNSCGFTFDEAKIYVIKHYKDKIDRLSLMSEDDWSNY